MIIAWWREGAGAGVTVASLVALYGFFVLALELLGNLSQSFDPIEKNSAK